MSASVLWSNVWWLLFGAALAWLGYWLVDLMLRGSHRRRLDGVRTSLAQANDTAARQQAEAVRLSGDLARVQTDRQGLQQSFAQLQTAAQGSEQKLTLAAKRVAELEASLTETRAQTTAALTKAQQELSQRAAHAAANDAEMTRLQT
jgi:predicted  nucleic acid-binding Zn-ribbon protein